MALPGAAAPSAAESGPPDSSDQSRAPYVLNHVNILGPIRGWVRGCWVWSAHPVVVFLALMLLIVQSWWFTRFEFDPSKTSRSRQALTLVKHFKNLVAENIGQYFIQSYPAIPDSVWRRYVETDGEQFFIAWDIELEQYLAEPRDHLRDWQYPFGSVTVEYSSASARTGIWAPTGVVRCRIRYDLKHVNEFERDLAHDLMADSYREHGGKHREMIASAIRNGDEIATSPLYSGYAHNAAAVLFLGVILRGIMNLLQRIWKRLRITRHRCVACGRDLRDLTRGRCPECGVLIPDVHTEIYTEREQIPGIESGVFGVAVGNAAAAGGGGHEADEDADRAGGDEPEPRR